MTSVRQVRWRERGCKREWWANKDKACCKNVDKKDCPTSHIPWDDPHTPPRQYIIQMLLKKLDISNSFFVTQDLQIVLELFLFCSSSVQVLEWWEGEARLRPSVLEMRLRHAADLGEGTVSRKKTKQHQDVTQNFGQWADVGFHSFWKVKLAFSMRKT